MKIKNAKFINEENTAVDLEVEHDTYGWIPYTFKYNEEDESLDSEIRNCLDTFLILPFEHPSDSQVVLRNEEDAKTERDNAEVSNIEVHEVEWQVRAVDRDRIKETIDTAYRKNRAEETINWILADNTIRVSTVKDLEDVLDAFSLRREDIFTQYAIWRKGDKLDPFEYI